MVLVLGAIPVLIWVSVLFKPLAYLQLNHGAHERVGRCAQVDMQRGEARKTPSADSPQLQSDRAIPHSNDEAR